MSRYRALVFAALAGVSLVAVPLAAQEREEVPVPSLGEQMRELLLEAGVLRDRLETLGHKLNALIERLEAEIADRESPPAQPSAPPAIGAGSEEAAVVPRQAVASPSTSREASAVPAVPPALRPGVSSVRQQFAWADRSPATYAQERQAYFDALAYLERGEENGDYRQFRAMLQRFIRTYRGGVYEPGARYLIADSYYAEKQYKRAAQGFLRYIEYFPHGDRADDARLKLAHIRYEQGEVAVAVRLLRQLSGSGDGRIRELAQRKLRLISKDADE